MIGFLVKAEVGIAGVVLVFMLFEKYIRYGRRQIVAGTKVD